METDGGSLNFDDLVDTTEDSFPGFGIEKFSAVNDTGNEKDDILETPEHSGDEGGTDDVIAKHTEGMNGVKTGIDMGRGNEDNLENEKTEGSTGSNNVEKIIENENSVGDEVDSENGSDHSEKLDHSDVDDCDDDVDNSRIDNEVEDDQIDGILSDNDNAGQSNDDDDRVHSESVHSEQNDAESRLSEHDNSICSPDEDEVQNGESVDDDKSSDNEPEPVAGINDNSKNSNPDDNITESKSDQDDQHLDEEDNDKETDEPNDHQGNAEEDEMIMECDDFVITQNTDDSDEEAESSDVKPDVASTNENQSEQHGGDEAIEPKPKKARLYLQPPKSKMKLWASSKSQVKKEVDSSPSKEKKSSRAGVANGTEVKEEPQQQSFLSFLNLQPGSAKMDNMKKKQEAKQEKEFYSRKRLRIRKAVSYVEDVAEENSDDDYKGSGDEEEPADHQFISEKIATTPRRRRSSPGNTGSFSIKSFAQAFTGASPETTIVQQIPVMPVVQASPQFSVQPRILAPKKPVAIAPLPHTTVNVTPPVNTSVANTAAMTINNRSLLNSNVKGLFECGLCGVFFNTASQFISHQNMEHTEETKHGKSAMESFRCEICQFVLTNRFAYLEHKRMKHTKQQFHFSCTKCPKTFSYLLDLQKHKQTCTGKSVWLNCQQCPAKYTNVADFQVHQQTVHSGAKFYCQNKQCNFKCATQNELKAHVQALHMISELFPCNAPKCARIFSTKEQLQEHKKSAHPTDFIVQYQCMECKSCFSSKTILAEHQYLHSMEKLKKCDLCSREFTTLPQLKKHREVHVCKGIVQCKSCSRWCMDDKELASHVCKTKMHKFVGSRIYFCDVCVKDFKSDEKMFAHRAEHKKYYQCGDCFLEMDTEEEYFVHREIHSCYTCSTCCEELKSQADLDTHKKAHDFYVKVDLTQESDDSDDENGDQPVMYLCPNLLNSLDT